MDTNLKAPTVPRRRRPGRPPTPREKQQTEVAVTRLTEGEKRRWTALLRQRGERESQVLRAFVLSQIADIADPGEGAEDEEAAA